VKPRVLIDVDGVLANFLSPSLSFLDHEFGVKVDPHTFPTWDLFETIDRRYLVAVETHWAQPGWCRAIPVYEGAQDAVMALREVADVYFVTAQMLHAPYWMWERVQWLKEHFSAEDRHIVLTLAKYLIEGDVLIDDKPANVRSWAAAHPEKQGVLWTQSYNLNHTASENVVRCGSWREVNAIVENLVRS
jgi:5'(3')-deoxyribonucleotidase